MPLTPTLGDNSTSLMQRQGTPYAQALAQQLGIDPSMLANLNGMAPQQYPGAPQPGFPGIGGGQTGFGGPQPGMGPTYRGDRLPGDGGPSYLGDRVPGGGSPGGVPPMGGGPPGAGGGGSAYLGDRIPGAGGPSYLGDPRPPNAGGWNTNANAPTSLPSVDTQQPNVVQWTGGIPQPTDLGGGWGNTAAVDQRNDTLAGTISQLPGSPAPPAAPPGNAPAAGGGAAANPLAFTSGLSQDQFAQIMAAMGGGQPQQPQAQSQFQQDPFSALGMVNAPQWRGVPNVGMPAFSQGAQVGAPSPFAPVAQVGAPPTPDAYRQALQAAYQPMFQNQQNQLAAREASMGILDSGGARKDFSDLTARNNATLAAGMQPLIQQGFGQQFSANEQNAGASNALNQQMTGLGFNAQQINAGNNQQSNLANQGAYNSYLQALQGQAYGGQQAQLDRQMQASGANAGSRNQLLSQLNQLGYQTGQGNADRSMQADQFNQSLLERLMSQNLGIQSQYGLAQLGYGHQDYSQALGALSGLEGTGLSNLGNILGQGMNNQWAGYLTGQQTGANYANQIGYNQGYGTGGQAPANATGVYQSGGASGPTGPIDPQTTTGPLGPDTYTPGGAAT